jgi:hypothetical protein
MIVQDRSGPIGSNDHAAKDFQTRRFVLAMTARSFPALGPCAPAHAREGHGSENDRTIMLTL